MNHCLHGELTEEERTKAWLSPTKHSHVLKDLAYVVLDKRLLNNVGYFLKFRYFVYIWKKFRDNFLLPLLIYFYIK